MTTTIRVRSKYKITIPVNAAVVGLYMLLKSIWVDWVSWIILIKDNSVKSLVGVIIWSNRGRIGSKVSGTRNVAVILVDSLNVSLDAREDT